MAYFTTVHILIRVVDSVTVLLSLGITLWMAFDHGRPWVPELLWSCAIIDGALALVVGFELDGGLIGTFVGRYPSSVTHGLLSKCMIIFLVRRRFW